MDTNFYTSPAWRLLRKRVLARDLERCTVGRLLGGQCSSRLHVHHIIPREERPDLALSEDNCATACDHHHPTWEALRRYIARSQRALPACPHNHPYAAGREACNRRRAQALGIVEDREDLVPA